MPNPEDALNRNTVLLQEINTVSHVDWMVHRLQNYIAKGFTIELPTTEARTNWNQIIANFLPEDWMSDKNGSQRTAMYGTNMCPFAVRGGVPPLLQTPDAIGYDIILIAGQSNGVGWAPGEYSATNDNVFALQDDNFSVVQASDPLPQATTVLTDSSFPSNYVSNGKGFALTFANLYVQNGYLRRNRRVLLVQTSVASVGFSQLDPNGLGWWSSSSPTAGGAAYVNCITRLTGALQQTLEGQTSIADNRVVAVCWQEGESDGQLNMDATTST